MSRNHPEIEWEKGTPKESTEEDIVEKLIKELDGREDPQWKRADKVKRLGGKNRIWHLFSLQSGGKRYIRCELCKREVFWNQSGLEKLKRHIQGHHINTKG
jgi:hypothetical protein